MVREWRLVFSSGRWIDVEKRVVLRLRRVRRAAVAVLPWVGVGGGKAEEIVFALEEPGRPFEQFQVHGPGAGVDI